MPTWILYAIASAAFAGLTSVLAKTGLRNVSSDLALTVRTSMVFLLIWLNALVLGQTRHFGLLTRSDVGWLCASGVTTALSWICYYRAVQQGTVGVVASIDKSSVVITILMSWLVLGEPITPRLLAGAGLIVAGMLVLIGR